MKDDVKPQLVSLYQKPEKIYPRAVSGRFALWRWVMVALTQAVFYGMPWLQWNGRQAVLFDLEAPRFYLFGLMLQPQDLIFLAGLLVLAALALFFFTAVAGRLWCGYACPQTVYTEIFLWIERHTEGDRAARIRLDRDPWNTNKVLRKGGKHLAWGLVALVTGFTFTGYFIPIRELAAQVATASVGAWAGFWILFYAFATYGNAGWMREQICKYMCPYARFQSALIDGDSLVIAYDGGRGEKRGARSKKADPKALGLGDCVDCGLCVQVCPTGIDIRNGLQNECIGCAACIDVCDTVMDRTGRPHGLIRYATGNGVARGWTKAQMLRRVWRPRVAIYGALLGASGLAFAVGVVLRQPVVMDVMRDRGVMARVVEAGAVENLYRVQLINRSDRAASYTLAAEGMPGLQLQPARAVALQPGEVKPFTVHLLLPPVGSNGAEPGAHPIAFTLTAEGAAAPLLRERSTFVVPR
ncbi:MAG: cytochrome c oxidase accessory protein CcoG [Rubrivivax sp.]